MHQRDVTRSRYQLINSLSDLAVARETHWRKSPEAANAAFQALSDAFARLKFDGRNKGAIEKTYGALGALSRMDVVAGRDGERARNEATLAECKQKVQTVARSFGQGSVHIYRVDANRRPVSVETRRGLADARSERVIQLRANESDAVGVLAESYVIINATSVSSAAGRFSDKRLGRDLREPRSSAPTDVLAWYDAWTAIERVSEATLPWAPEVAQSFNRPVEIGF